MEAEFTNAELRALNVIVPWMEKGGKAVDKFMEYMERGQLGDAVYTIEQNLEGPAKYLPPMGLPGLVRKIWDSLPKGTNRRHSARDDDR